MIDLDVAGVRRLWRETSPHLPQPKDDGEALATLHRARTQTESIPEKLRLYSHRWLVERGIPSGLPDALLPKAEQVRPRVVDAVGISVNTSREELLPAAREIEGAMSDAVADAYAEGRTDTEFVRARMAEARAVTRRKLFGSTALIR